VRCIGSAITQASSSWNRSISFAVVSMSFQGAITTSSAA
jgi:hypothetical protein